ncbi:MAG: hypothetical protein JST54_21565 [Deltaproteobacteria bacterium]|nr:hypothetical protein [Deltaproteobacteria bacterium]
MGPLLPKLSAALIALALAGDGIVNDQSEYAAPTSQTGGMTVMDPTQQSVYGMTDAGLLWEPKAEEMTVQALDAGAKLPDAGLPPEANVQGACAPIAQRIAHRRTYLAEVEKKSNEVGLEHGAQAYCELHPTEIECRRPPTAVERDLADLIQNSPDDPVPESDAWIVRWLSELKTCQAQQRETPRARVRK